MCSTGLKYCLMPSILMRSSKYMILPDTTSSTTTAWSRLMQETSLVLTIPYFWLHYMKENLYFWIQTTLQHPARMCLGITVGNMQIIMSFMHSHPLKYLTCFINFSKISKASTHCYVQYKNSSSVPQYQTYLKAWNNFE